MTPEELLEKSAEVIATHGLRKRDLGRPEDGFCAMGGICYVKNGMLSDSPSSAGYNAYPIKDAVELLADTIGLEYGSKKLYGAWQAVVDWNNAPERTGEDVVLAMKKAAHHDT